MAKIKKLKQMLPRGQLSDYIDIGAVAETSLVGTGDYKLYNMPIANQNYKGKILNFGLVNNNESNICYFDSFNI